jgi:hypothetical protein
MAAAATQDLSPEQARERLVTLAVQGLLVLVPCAIWYVQAGQLAQNALSLSGMIIGTLATAGAITSLIAKSGR